MLLRIAIGWHFLYEGLEKYESTRRGEPFTAEPYLRNATGPLAPSFRAMVPDVNSLAVLDPARLKAGWAADVERIANHFGFDRDQRDRARAALRASEGDADLWFQDSENAEKRLKYYHDLRAIQAIERNPSALPYEREWAAAKRRDLDADRRELIDDLLARGAALREAVTKLATDQQRDASGPAAPPMTTLDWINLATTYGLIAMGLGLMAGFLTPLAALAGAVFLGQVYLSMPPWPGIPANPASEGHYLYVSKNLIEMIACLALVFIPTGRWVGLDALLFNWRDRRRARDDSRREPLRTIEPRPQLKDTGSIRLS